MFQQQRVNIFYNSDNSLHELVSSMFLLLNIKKYTEKSSIHLISTCSAFLYNIQINLVLILRIQFIKPIMMGPEFSVR